jgi:Transposase DDE domain group 1
MRMTSSTTTQPSTQKVRRDVTGGKRGDGNERTARIRRADPRKIARGKADPSLTAVAGLVAFGIFLRKLGVDRQLRDLFWNLKSSPSVIYGMPEQMRLLIDAFVTGEQRVFGLEALAADPLYVLLAGGVVPSIDTVYRDLARFDEPHLLVLDTFMAAQTIAEAKRRRMKEAHLDIDTTVEPLFGNHEGGVPGYNPRYHGRPSYHPIVARLAELDMLLGAKLRPGDTTFGADDVAYVVELVRRARRAVGPACLLYTRIDAAGDCTEVMKAIAAEGAYFLTKARVTPDLAGAVHVHAKWTTVDRDAFGKPTRQVAEIDFARGEWKKAGLKVRVIAIRSNERDNGKQLYLWDGLDYTVQVFLANEPHSDAEDLAKRYDKRAGIEPVIAEMKNGFGVDKVPSANFNANHAALLLKALAYNLLRRYVRAAAPPLTTWRAAWIRRAIIVVPGRIVRSGRRRTLRPAPRPMLPMLN